MSSSAILLSIQPEKIQRSTAPDNVLLKKGALGPKWVQLGYAADTEAADTEVHFYKGSLAESWLYPQV